MTDATQEPGGAPDPSADLTRQPSSTSMSPVTRPPGLVRRVDDCHALGFAHKFRDGSCESCGEPAKPEERKAVVVLVHCYDCKKLCAGPEPAQCPACERRWRAAVRQRQETGDWGAGLDDEAEAEHEERADICEDFGRIGDE